MFEGYYKEMIGTIIIIFFFLFIRFVLKSLTTKFARKSGLSRPRIKMVLKYLDFLLFVLATVMLITAWGVEKRQAFLVISSVFTVIGVAMFAQWSILSNITAGIIIFFSFPFRIGDRIKVLDKDEPIEAEIIDIKSFYTLLRNDDGERISYPNNQLLQKGVLIRHKKN
ncbi:MAG: mechanosensitive ion channel family protein [Flavobacteriaceae bacterium]|nr:mechanosensitive ion channel family protein [Flavobacteriaceae bacterium]